MKKKTRGKDHWVIQFYISNHRWKICNVHRPIPNSNRVLACATGDGLWLALWNSHGMPHPISTPPQHHTLIGPLLFNLFFGTQIMCIYIPLVLSCYTSVLALLQYSHCLKPNNTSKVLSVLWSTNEQVQ